MTNAKVENFYLTKYGHVSRVHIVFRVDHSTVHHSSSPLMSHTKEDHHKYDGDGNRNSDDKCQFPSANAKKAAIPTLRICSKQPIEYKNQEIKI